MNTSMRSTSRTLWVAVRAVVLFTIVLGIAYTFVLTGIGQLLLPAQANGSLVHDQSGAAVGSSLIGQSFTDADGAPIPKYFQSRPSANDYDGQASGGTNLGPENPKLVAAIQERKTMIAELEGVPESKVPADAVTASASGLDPDISPEYAAIQVSRVAEARGITAEQVRELVDAHTAGRNLGYLGEPTVNVLELNLALDELTEG
ncbi:potassium-transporting ATPase subunit KdpC [Leucobacter viscericola]|uniref:Potassium-transporting ATPase KdpC subunit n=1 Tax=Leucobacter viscericola TaxID=2714935 RepID=A0A6G7XG38_9MICO|nr:potassium-transporting ATPase subunit KdpC [Leucobacter viscericola]QIK63564.1 potassium-transporting ATPase subunit KdpC [Leucobacter viscericola]